MPPRKIQDHHHVAKHCSAKDFADDEMTELNEDVLAPTMENPDVSVNWLEYHRGKRETQIAAVCRDIASERIVKPRHKLAILGVEQTKSIGDKFGETLDVVHQSSGRNASHSVISGLPIDARALHKLLADAASEEIVPVVIPNQ